MDIKDLFPDGVLSTLTDEQKEALFRDRRRKTKAPDGIIPGTNAYQRWYREQNRERARLYQRRSYLKKRLLNNAFEKANEKGTSVSDQLKEIEEAISSLKQVEEMEASATPDVTALVIEDGQIPFVAEEAARLGISYFDCLSFMQSDDYRGEESWETESGKKLLEIFRLSTVTAASAKR